MKILKCSLRILLFPLDQSSKILTSPHLKSRGIKVTVHLHFLPEEQTFSLKEARFLKLKSAENVDSHLTPFTFR